MADSADDNHRAASIRASAAAWCAIDPDPQDRASIEDLLGLHTDEADRQLSDWFDGRISFGTAGLRAPLGPGPNRMNRLVVQQTTAGLMRFLPAGALVVIGFDHRHGSRQFALDTAGVVAAAGGIAKLLPGPGPTPVLAAAVLRHGADAGVMITASHNPKDDNGYKLYLADGIQLTTPADLEIALAIDAVAGIAPPCVGVGEWSNVAVADHEAVTVLGQEIVEHHLDLAVSALVTGGPDENRTPTSVRVVYTPMHGVGGQHLLRAFDNTGFEPPIVVAAQFDPDPNFPTVAFPNPEEPGALDAALDLALEHKADLVLANDPDADRLAVAVPSRPGVAHPYTALSGDELGVLLADHLLRHTSGSNRQVARSIVSSRLLDAMAKAVGVDVNVTLTGFKWVARPIVDRPDQSYVIGYEEALGYCIGSSVRDKDGISAALVATEMLGEALAAGETLWARLDRLAVSHGLHRTRPLSVRFDDAKGTLRPKVVLEKLLADPPVRVAGANRRRCIDLAVDSELGLPTTPGLLLDFDDDTQVIVRPSGTEPKLKAYVEVIVPVQDETGLPDANRVADERLRAHHEWLKARLGT